MSSHWGKLKYDECAYNQDVKVTTEVGMYHLHLPTFQNNLGMTADIDTCGEEVRQKIGCAPCNLNKNANLNNEINTINNEILDIDSELRLYKPKASKCGINKYQAGFLNPDRKKNIVVTPNLCDRSIVPSNMVPVINSGLKYDF